MDRLEIYLSRLYGYAVSLARDPETAKDLVQQCALKSLSAKSVPADKIAYRAWLFVILRNAFIDHVRRNRLADDLVESEPPDDPSMEYWEGDERLINILNVKQAMVRLHPRDREIIGLVVLAGLSYAETARIPFARNMPSGFIPEAMAANPFKITGKDGLTVLNDRPVNAEIRMLDRYPGVSPWQVSPTGSIQFVRRWAETHMIHRTPMSPAA